MTSVSGYQQKLKKISKLFLNFFSNRLKRSQTLFNEIFFPTQFFEILKIYFETHLTKLCDKNKVKQLQ